MLIKEFCTLEVNKPKRKALIFEIRECEEYLSKFTNIWTFLEPTIDLKNKIIQLLEKKYREVVNLYYAGSFGVSGSGNFSLSCCLKIEIIPKLKISSPNLEF